MNERQCTLAVRAEEWPSFPCKSFRIVSDLIVMHHLQLERFASPFNSDTIQSDGKAPIASVDLSIEH